MFTHRQRLQLAASWCALSVLLAFAPLTSGKNREDCERQYQPQSGQPGKDVVWVPTNDALVTRMLQMAAVTSADQVYDLGAGDGKIAIAAARDFGAKAVGVEYDADMARLAQCLVEAEGVGNRVRIIQGDIFETDFSTATVLTLYLLPELNLRLRPTILKMKPGTRVVSHSFRMEDWEPDDRSFSEDGQAYLWIVPANVSGTWMFRQQDGEDHFPIQLEQTFQHVGGTVGTSRQPIADARLNGTQLSLDFTDNGTVTKVGGRVEGDRIQARVTRGTTTTDYIGTRL